MPTPDSFNFKQMRFSTSLTHRRLKAISVNGVVLRFDDTLVAEVHNADDIEKVLQEADQTAIFALSEAGTDQGSSAEGGDGGQESLTAQELQQFKKDELVAIATEAGFDEDEWKSLNKNELIAYIVQRTGE